MVDLTNKLGFRVLYQHSVANRNNIAFSPCGLASVLVALYEGSDGPSSMQIHKALEFPWDRDLVRIGFRDIHRRLRSYFYSQDNLLSGLSLSEPNVTVRPEYENILRFYGYDLDNGNMITSSGKACKPNETEVIPETTTEQPEMTTIIMTTEEELITTTEMATEPPTTTATTTTTPVTTTTVKETTTMMVTLPPTTFTPPPPPPETTTQEPVTESTTMAEARTTQYIYTFKPPRATTELAESEALQSTTTAYDTTTGEAVTEAASSSTTEDDLNALKRRRRRKNRTFNRWKRSPMPLHYFISPYDQDEDSPPSDLFLNYGGVPGAPFAVNDFVVQQPSFNLRDTLNEPPQHEDVITHLFYLNRQETINVPFKVFNSIMKYGYFSSIQSAVLEVDLDSKNYSLLLILPDWLDFGLDGLITSLKSAYSPHLREIRSALQPTWIKAIIPKFFLTGHIVLTADLQNVKNVINAISFSNKIFSISDGDPGHIRAESGRLLTHD